MSGEPPPGEIDPRPDPASRSVASVAAELGSDLDAGLGDAEVLSRAARFGPNELRSTPPTPAWRRLLDQFVDPLVWLLVGAAAVSTAAWVVEGAEGAPIEALVIAVIVVANALIGFVQEGRAVDAVAALRRMTTTTTTVVRDGVERRLPAPELVPGDVVLLAEGDAVPADARVAEAVRFRVAEAALTGESEPVDKRVEPVEPGLGVGDRSSMVFSGTAVVGGRARVVVTGTGMATEIGRIADLLDDTEQERTSLQREIDLVGRVLGVAVVAIAVLVVVVQLLVEDIDDFEGYVEVLLIGVSLAVAAVPEGLPAVLSLVLALGVQRLADRRALVKRLASVETLGSADVICSDKTGTLTRNEMIVRAVATPSGVADVRGEGYGPDGSLEVRAGSDTLDHLAPQVRLVIGAGALASDARVERDADGRWQAAGDPTEAAVVAAQPRVGIDEDRLRGRFRRVAEVPFDSDRKRMSTLHLDTRDGGRTLLVKGAPDVLLERAVAELVDGREVPLDADRRARWSAMVEDLADEALRTLAVAYRRFDDGRDPEPDDEAELVLLGVLGLLDPPRSEAGDAVAEAHRAGIRVVMITGDHPATAARIAADLGIEPEGRPPVTGSAVAATADEALPALVASTNVFARIAPEDKLRIVQALRADESVVSMTGDGVNDAPALRAADIGVAMGVTGTEVSKEAADLILLDDDFATIVAAVHQGRAIFANIRSFLRYLLGSNIGEVFTVLGGILLAGVIGLTAPDGAAVTPLLATQILWINLVTDAAPALALGVDPAARGLMDRPPRRPDERVIDGVMQVGIAITGVTMAVVTLAAIDLTMPGGLFDGDADLTYGRTAAFTVLVLAQLFNTINSRSDVHSAFRQGTHNRLLIGAVGISLLAQVAVVHLPFLNTALDTTPLSPADWALCVALASTVTVVAEIRKAVTRALGVRAA